MGLDFRGSEYARYVRLGKRTVKAGEAAVVWNMNGVQTEVIGPSLQRLFFSYIRFLDCKAATSNEYLEVHYADGKVENLVGPVSVWQNPVFHKSVEVKPRIVLKSSEEHLVVYTKAFNAGVGYDDDGVSGGTKQDYKKEIQNGSVCMTATTNNAATNNINSNLVRTIISGPRSFVPSVDDKVHAFQEIDNAGKVKKFNILSSRRTFSDLELTLKTADNEDSIVKLTVEVEATDLPLFLNRGANDDLRSKVVISLTSDILDIGSTLKWSEVAGKLRCNDNWPKLKSNLEEIGHQVKAVTYLGFKPSIQVQTAYTEHLRRTAQKEKDKVLLEEENLREEKARDRDIVKAKEELAFELEKAKAKASVEYLENEALAETEKKKLQGEEEIFELRSKVERKRREDKVAGERLVNDEMIRVLSNLNDMNVDLNAILGKKVGSGGDGKGLNDKYTLVGKMVANAPAFHAVWKNVEEKDDSGGGFELC